MTEETGYHPRIGPYLTTVRYPVTSSGRSANKVVTYWSMRCAGGSFLASREVDQMQWLPLDEAVFRLSSLPTVLSCARSSARAGTPTRCCWSGTGRRCRLRGGSGGDPKAQRLNRSGRDQAASLVPVLAGLGVTDLLSADLPACVDMLAPFAAATGLTVRREAQLTCDGFAGNEMDVADRVRHHASFSEALVVCGGQRVITGLLRALGHGSDVRPPNQTTVKKGGWWLLHHRDGAVSAYERHGPAA